MIAPDTPGFGTSRAPNWRYSAPVLGRWLDAFLDAVGARPAMLVGNSLGGRLALELALQDPGAVTRMVLLCPSPAFRRGRQFVPLLRLLPRDVGRAPVVAPRPVVRGVLRAMFAQPDRLPPTWYDSAVDEFHRTMARHAHRRAFLSATVEIYLDEPFGAAGFWDRLPKLAVPALFVWGQRDRLVPAAFARHVTAAVPAAGSTVLADCGHVPQYELPQQTITLTRRFLAADRRAEASPVSSGRACSAPS